MLSSVSSSYGPVAAGHSYYDEAYYDDDDDDQAVVVYPEENMLATIAEEGDDSESDDGMIHQGSAAKAMEHEDEGDGHLWDEDDDDGYEEYYEDDYGDGGFMNEPYGNEFLDTILEEEDEDEDSSLEDGQDEEEPKPPPLQAIEMAATLMHSVVKEKKELDDDMLDTSIPFEDAPTSTESDSADEDSTPRAGAFRIHPHEYPIQQPSATAAKRAASPWPDTSVSKEWRGSGLGRTLTPHPGFADADADEKASNRLARDLASAEMRKAEQGGRGAQEATSCGEDDFCALESQTMNLEEDNSMVETDSHDDIPSLSQLTGKEYSAMPAPSATNTNRGSLLEGEEDNLEGRTVAAENAPSPEIGRDVTMLDVEQGAGVEDGGESEEDIPHATRLESSGEFQHQRHFRSSIESLSAASASAPIERTPSTRRRWEAFLRVPQATVTAVLPRTSRNFTSDEGEDHNSRTHKIGCHEQCSCSIGILGILAIATLLLLVLVAAVVLSLFFLDARGDSSSTAPTTQPFNREEELFPLVSEFVVDKASLLNTSSPQYLAYRWLVDTDELPLDPVRNYRRIKQRYSLFVGFYALGGPEVMEKTRLFEPMQHECDFSVPFAKSTFGIGCKEIREQRDDGSEEKDRFVVSLRFGLNVLHGDLYPEAVLLEPYLKVFDLSSNLIQGTIPTEYGSFGDGFQELSLGRNLLEGTIPTELGNLKSLRILDLRETKLTGPIPTELAQLPSLERLALSRNPLLEGTFPLAMTALSSSLNELYLQQTNLEGSLAFMCSQDAQKISLPSSRSPYLGFLSDCGQLSQEDALPQVPRIDCPCCTGCYPSEVPPAEESFDRWECPSPDEIKFDLELTSDRKGHETTWNLTTQLVDVSPNIFRQSSLSEASELQNVTQVVAQGGPFWSNSLDRQRLCLPKDQCYTWTIYDLTGDGLCCSGGIGNVALRINDEILVSNIGPDAFRSRWWTFGDC